MADETQNDVTQPCYVTLSDKQISQWGWVLYAKQKTASFVDGFNPMRHLSLKLIFIVHYINSSLHCARGAAYSNSPEIHDDYVQKWLIVSERRRFSRKQQNNGVASSNLCYWYRLRYWYISIHHKWFTSWTVNNNLWSCSSRLQTTLNYSKIRSKLRILSWQLSKRLS